MKTTISPSTLIPARQERRDSAPAALLSPSQTPYRSILARTFARLGIHEEAEQALLFLEVACRGHVATPELAEGVGRFLDRAANDRRLRFDPGLYR